MPGTKVGVYFLKTKSIHLWIPKFSDLSNFLLWHETHHKPNLTTLNSLKNILNAVLNLSQGDPGESIKGEKGENGVSGIQVRSSNPIMH